MAGALALDDVTPQDIDPVRLKEMGEDFNGMRVIRGGAPEGGKMSGVRGGAPPGGVLTTQPLSSGALSDAPAPDGVPQLPELPPALKLPEKISPSPGQAKPKEKNDDKPIFDLDEIMKLGLVMSMAPYEDINRSGKQLLDMAKGFYDKGHVPGHGNRLIPIDGWGLSQLIEEGGKIGLKYDVNRKGFIDPDDPSKLITREQYEARAAGKKKRAEGDEEITTHGGKATIDRQTHATNAGVDQQTHAVNAGVDTKEQAKRDEFKARLSIVEKGAERDRLDESTMVDGVIIDVPQADGTVKKVEAPKGFTIKDLKDLKAGKTVKGISGMPVEGTGATAGAGPATVGTTDYKSEGDKEVEKGEIKRTADYWKNLDETRRPAAEQGREAVRLAQAIPVKTGKFSEELAGVGAVMSTLGFDNRLTQHAKDFQEFKGVVTQMVNVDLQANKGVQTEGDAERALRAIGNTSNMTEVKDFLLRYRRAQYERTLDEHSVFRAHVDEKKDPRGADSKWNKAKQEAPFMGFDPKTSKPIFYNEFIEAASRANPDMPREQLLKVWRENYVGRK